MLLDEPSARPTRSPRGQMQEWLLNVWAEDRKTILFVTHDVEEAAHLSDRVYVMSGRPGQIALNVEINLDRPRKPEVGHSRVPRLEEVLVPLEEAAMALRPAIGGVRQIAGDSRLRKIARVVLPPLVFAIVVLTLWQPLRGVRRHQGSLRCRSRPRSPSPLGNREMLIENAWVTIKEILLGFTLAIIIGVSMALLIRSSKTAERAGSSVAGRLADGPDPGDRADPRHLDRLRHAPQGPGHRPGQASSRSPST